MPNTKIIITPGELLAQASEMNALQEQYSDLFGNVTSELNKVNSNWSTNLAHNFCGKINSSNKSFLQVTQELMNGARVAKTCSETFESVDSQLAKLIETMRCQRNYPMKQQYPRFQSRLIWIITCEMFQMQNMHYFVIIGAKLLNLKIR